MARTSAAASNGGGGAASGAPAPDARDLESTWLYLENGITHIMTRLSEGLSYASYMNLYTYAFPLSYSLAWPEALALGSHASGRVRETCAQR